MCFELNEDKYVKFVLYFVELVERIIEFYEMLFLLLLRILFWRNCKFLFFYVIIKNVKFILFIVLEYFSLVSIFIRKK